MQRAHRAALGLLLVPALACAPEPAGPPNLVLVTVESLRTDHVGFHAGRRDATPHLDRLARESVVYEDAHSVTSWTLTAHASLFTGLYPLAHGVIRPRDRLPDAHETLAESLAAAGYQTAGIVSGPYLRRDHDLHQGFARYDESPAAPTPKRAHGDVTSPAVVASAERFLREERRPDRPFLLFLYLWDPHYDYLPPPPWDRRFTTPDMTPVDVHGWMSDRTVTALSPPEELAWAVAQYDGEIAWTDHHLGRLFGVLREEELWDRTAIVVTADHGEEFFDHGEKGHKHNLFAETVHVPLVVKYPGGRPRGRDPRLASLVDVAPTLLELAGVAPPRPLHGRSLRDPPDPERPVFFDLLSIWRRPGGPTLRERWQGVRRGPHKWLEVSTGERFLFAVDEDPGEQRNLLDSGRPPAADALATLLEAHRDRMADARETLPEVNAADLDRERRERLRALGYLPEE